MCAGKPVLSPWSRQSGVSRLVYSHSRPASSTCIAPMVVVGDTSGPAARGQVPPHPRVAPRADPHRHGM